MKPTAGRIVHYVDRHPTDPQKLMHRAAIFIIVEDDMNYMRIFGHVSDMTLKNVPQDEEKKSYGTWHLPERVAE